MTKWEVWSEEEVEMLRSLIAEGHSAGTAAEALRDRNRGGRVFTRNGVIGKCRRLGIKLAAPMHRVKSSSYDRPKGEPVSVSLVDTHPEHITLRPQRPEVYKRKGTCTYIKDNKEPCGLPCNGPYCEEHHRLTHVKRED